MSFTSSLHSPNWTFRNRFISSSSSLSSIASWGSRKRGRQRSGLRQNSDMLAISVLHYELPNVANGTYKKV